MKDLPGIVFLDIKIGVSCLDFAPIDSHGKLVNAIVLGPILTTNLDVGSDDFALRLFEQKGIKVILDTVIVGTGGITDRGQQDGILGITGCHDAAVAGRQGVVPELCCNENV